MRAPDRTDVKVFLGSLAVVAPLSLVDLRYGDAAELRGWQLPALVVALGIGAAGCYVDSEHGLLSWFRPARRLERHLATFLLALAVVVALYGVFLAFR